MDVIVGAPSGDVTVKEELLVTVEPPDTETLIGPVVAPAGTVTINCVFEAAVTVAAVPLN
jgi:hypothetical protein